MRTTTPFFIPASSRRPSCITDQRDVTKKLNCALYSIVPIQTALAFWVKPAGDRITPPSHPSNPVCPASNTLRLPHAGLSGGIFAIARVELGLVLPWRCPGCRRMVAYPRWAYRVNHHHPSRVTSGKVRSYSFLYYVSLVRKHST